MKISVIMVDDHPIVRDGLRAVLGSRADLDLVGEAGDGLEVLPLVERLHPDVLVLDLMLPGMNGLEVARQVHSSFPSTRIVILSMHASEAYVMEAFRSGASAYVLKKAASTDLIQAIHAVVEGKRYLSAPLSEKALAEFQVQSAQDTLDPFETLTQRERQVMQLVAEGLSNNEAAAYLHLSRRTVEMHRANLMRKLGLHTTAELVRLAIQKGLVAQE